MPDATRPEFTAEQLAEVRRLHGLYPDKRGALLPVLRLAQETFGYISLEVEEYVAGLFDLSAAHVHEVVTFYTLFFQQPPGRHVVSVCHNLSCHLMGSKGIESTSPGDWASRSGRRPRTGGSRSSRWNASAPASRRR
jgi:NADH:ubiquinone oxidoreductase subunit E